MLYLTECDDAAIALCPPLKRSIKLAVETVRALLAADTTAAKGEG